MESPEAESPEPMGNPEASPETMESHKADLEKLAERDPEFYKFLKEQEADLLEFDESDYEMEDEEAAEREAGEDEEEEEEDEEQIKIGKHSISIKYDDKDQKIASQQLADVIEEVLSNPTEKRAALRAAVTTGIRLFQACTAKVGAKVEKPEFVITSNNVLDCVVRACLKNMGRCLLILMDPLNKKPKKVNIKKETSTVFKFWKKYRALAKSYLVTFIKFMAEQSDKETNIACVRSILDLADLFVHFPQTCRLLVKQLVKIWARKSIDERCIAFLALSKLCRSNPDLFPTVYKRTYVAYVSASRNVTASAWPKLQFMQNSFAELTYLFPTTAYKHAFVYIRQFAIHLRNAVIAKRKDVIKTVYNWQYILGLYLWSTVMIRGRRHMGESEGVEWILELLYPLIQITIGLVSVFMAPRYVPLRLHCVRILLQLQTKFKTYIPTLNLAADCLQDLARIDKKKPTNSKVLQKTTEIKDMIRLTNEMVDDMSYRRAVAKEIYAVLTEAAQIIKDDPAFFEVYIPVKVTIKNFMDECKNVEHKKLFKEFEKAVREMK